MTSGNGIDRGPPTDADLAQRTFADLSEAVATAAIWLEGAEEAMQALREKRFDQQAALTMAGLWITAWRCVLPLEMLRAQVSAATGYDIARPPLPAPDSSAGLDDTIGEPAGSA